MVGQHLSSFLVLYASYAASSVAKCLPSFPLPMRPFSLSLSFPLGSCLARLLYLLYLRLRVAFIAFTVLYSPPHTPQPSLPLAALLLALFAAYLSLPTPLPVLRSLLPFPLFLSKHLTIEAHFFACASFVNFPVISHKIHLQLISPHSSTTPFARPLLSPGSNHPHRQQQQLFFGL